MAEDTSIPPVADESGQPIEDISASEELQNIHKEIMEMAAKYQRMSVSASQQGDPGTANIYMKLATDFLPLLADLALSNRGQAADFESLVEDLDEAGILSDEDDLPEDGAGAGDDDAGPSLDENQIAVTKTELETLYRFVHTIATFFEVAAAQNLYKGKSKVKQATEALQGMCKTLTDVGVQYGIIPGEGVAKFRADLEASYK